MVIIVQTFWQHPGQVTDGFLLHFFAVVYWILELIQVLSSVQRLSILCCLSCVILALFSIPKIQIYCQVIPRVCPVHPFELKFDRFAWLDQSIRNGVTYCVKLIKIPVVTEWSVSCSNQNRPAMMVWVATLVVKLALFMVFPFSDQQDQHMRGKPGDPRKIVCDLTGSLAVENPRGAQEHNLLMLPILLQWRWNRGLRAIFLMVGNNAAQYGTAHDGKEGTQALTSAASLFVLEVVELWISPAVATTIARQRE